MVESREQHYVICITGTRIVTKRMAVFLEGVRGRGTSIRVWSLPRNPWVLDKSENPTKPDRVGKVSFDLGPISGAKLTSIMCFHWSVLPIAVILGMIRGVPVHYDEYDHFEINQLEGNDFWLKRRAMSLVVRWIHRICLPWVSVLTCIHMDQQALRRHLEQWQPRILEIHNYPASVWRESGRMRTPSGRLCFVYIGGVYVEKGVGASAEAFLGLPDSVRENTELHIFGEGDQELIRKLQTMPGVIVHRGVTPAEFRKFTATRRCCGLALLSGTPRYRMVGTNCTKLFEYLALGMPVIGTRVGEFPQWIDGRRVGLLIDDDLNTQQLAKQMQKLSEDTVFFDECSRNATALMASDEMTWEYEWSRIAQTDIIKRRAA